MVHFEGRETFNSPITHMFGVLTDAGFLAHCLPDAEIHEATPDKAVWKLKPKLSFLTGSLETTLTVVSREENSTARYTVLGKAIGAGSTVAATLVFSSSAPDVTEVVWSADITALSGLLKMVPKGLIQSAAQTVITDVWAAVHAKVA